MKIGYISKLSNLHTKTDRVIINCPGLGMLQILPYPPLVQLGLNAAIGGTENSQFPCYLMSFHPCSLQNASSSCLQAVS